MVKRLLNVKKCLKKRRGEFKEAEIVLIRINLGTGRQLVVVQRFKLAFIGENWLPVR